MIDIVLIDYEGTEVFTETQPWPCSWHNEPAPVVQTTHLACSVFLRTDDWLTRDDKRYRIYKPAPVINLSSKARPLEDQVKFVRIKPSPEKKWWKFIPK